MEKFVQRENGFLGFSHHQGLSNSSPRMPNDRSSEDMDFNDVFGGPPRRLSIQEVKLRYSFGETEESAEEIAVSSPWSSISEKPVFGEDSVPRKRHHQGDNFFDDIFRGEDSYSSPRRTDRDSAFGSSPGSRVLSPAKPLPPKVEPFLNSVPSQFSLPAKLTKGLEISTFASDGQCKMDGSTKGLNSPHSSNSVLRFPSEAIQSQDENLVYRQSPLSRGVSLRAEDFPSMTMPDPKENVDNLRKDRRNVDCIGNQFHFSIYKWAGREVPMLLPLVSRTRDGSKCDRSASSNGRIESKQSDHVMKSRRHLAAGSDSLNAETKEAFGRVEDMKGQQDSVEEKKLYETLEVKSRISRTDTVVEEKTEREVPLKKEASLRFEPKPLHAFLGDETTDVKEKTETEVPLKKEKSLRFELNSLHTLLRDKIDVMEKTEDKVPLNKEESVRYEHKPLHAFLSDADKQPGNKVEMKESKNRIPNGIHRCVPDSNTVDKNEGTRVSSSKGTIDKSSLQAAVKNSGVTTPRENGVKGKVREFVQIFNKEADSRPMADSQRSRSSRWKTVDINQKENGMSVDAAAEAKEKIDLHNVAKKPYISIKGDENLNHYEAQRCSPAKDTSYTPRQSSTNLKNGFASERFRRDSKIYMEFDDPLEDVFLVQELPDDHEEVTDSEDLDDTKVIDAKIRQWSYGKKGNIRSLLSTLQFVLWPESGWKPVPLADLIETNSVKRAYQKALLRLHPDKLQQKGAAFHQKYTAEKVFGILQEAWDQFNALVPL